MFSWEPKPQTPLSSDWYYPFSAGLVLALKNVFSLFTKIKNLAMDWKVLIDIIGWVGSLELILAYLLVSYEKIGASTRIYQWLNLTGSILLMINTAYYGAFPSTFVNVIWILIAVAALYRIMFKINK